MLFGLILRCSFCMLWWVSLVNSVCMSCCLSFWFCVFGSMLMCRCVGYFVVFGLMFGVWVYL